MNKLPGYTRLLRSDRDMAGRLLETYSVAIADENMPIFFNSVELDRLAKGHTVILCDGPHEVFSHYAMPSVN